MTARRENSSARRHASRAPRTRLLIVCGARRTEPAYLEGLRTSVRNPAVVLKVVTKDRDPRAVVDYARRFREQAQDDYDEVWCILDVDEFDFRKALLDADKHRISLAISNPCFELWLLLHHCDVTAPLRDAAETLARLKQTLPGYNKTALRFEDFAEFIQSATHRGRRLSVDGSPLGPNPSSGMWRLVELIIDDGMPR